MTQYKARTGAQEEGPAKGPRTDAGRRPGGDGLPGTHSPAPSAPADFTDASDSALAPRRHAGPADAARDFGDVPAPTVAALLDDIPWDSTGKEAETGLKRSGQTVYDRACERALAANLPARLRGRVRRAGRVWHVSAELVGNMDLDAALASLADLGLPRVVWHGPAAFDRLLEGGAVSGSGDAGADGGFPRRPAADVPADDFDTAEVSGTWVDRTVRRLFAKAMERRVSDIHISYMGPYTQVFFRRMGLMLEEETLDGERGLQLIRGIFQGELSQAEAGFSEHERYDGRIADRAFLPEGLFAVRLHSEPVQSPYMPGPGVHLAMRLLFDSTRARGTMDQRLAALGFTRGQREMVAGFAETTGMTVVSGPTGHGKTTVLKNILEAQASHVPTRSYFSLEDPPEYTIAGVHQLNVFTKAVSEQERKRALLEALAGLMRSDPDVILLGEIRYREAAEAAVSAALTGHSVWTTVHASTALNVLSRLREMGVALSSLTAPGVLAGVTYQRLLPVLCPRCSRPLREAPEAVSPACLFRLRRLFSSAELEGVRVRGAGCPDCDGLGLSGQQVAAEVVPLRDHELTRLIAGGRFAEAWRHWVLNLGGLTHQAHARRRVLAGEVDPGLCEERLGTTLDADLVELGQEARVRPVDPFDTGDTGGTGRAPDTGPGRPGAGSFHGADAGRFGDVPGRFGPGRGFESFADDAEVWGRAFGDPENRAGRVDPRATLPHTSAGAQRAGGLR